MKFKFILIIIFKQGFYFVKDFPLNGAQIPNNILLMLPQTQKVKIFQSYFVKYGSKKPIVKIFSSYIVVSLVK